MFDFSRTEIRVILFLILLLLVGSGITLYRRYHANQSIDIVTILDKSTQAREKPTVNREVDRGVVEPTTGNGEQIKRGTDSPSKIDINTASAYELEGLPGVGPVLARRIIEYREKHGGFKTLSELEEVTGVGDKKLESIRDYICIK